MLITDMRYWYIISLSFKCKVLIMKNKEAIVEILGLEDDQVSNLESDNKMKDYNFDSLAIVMLQSFIDEEYNIQIDPDNLPSFESINDLDVYIESHKS